MNARRLLSRVPTSRYWSWIAALFAVTLAGIIVQQTAGLWEQREVDIGVHLAKQNRRRFSGRQNHYAALIPARYRTDLVMARGVMLEDGKPLPHRRISVANFGDVWGAYVMTHKYVHFRPSDGSDPNRNGKRYTLRVPRQVKPGVLWGLFGGLAISTHLALRRRPGSPLPSPRRTPPWLEGAVVALVSLGGGLVALHRFSGLNDGGLCVLGKPYSDAVGWHQVALFLRHGLGFTADYADNRPFYPIFQAMVFLFTGDSVRAAQGTNVFLLAMGGFFAYAAARELFSRPVALGVLVFVVMAENYQRMAPMLLTELPAFAFGAAGVFLLARGCSPEPVPRRGWALCLSGVFLACSNLARPHTFFALPLAGLVILHAGFPGRWGARATFIRGLVFGCGIVAVFFPWCLREKRVHGTWSISLNSSEMLYATASTKGGKWNQEEFDEAARDGYTKADPAALHRYFGRRLAEVVKADPGAYAATVGRGWIDFIRAFTIEKPVVLAVLALSVFATLLTGAMAARSVLPLLGFPLFWLFGSWADGWRGYELVPAAVLVLLLIGGKRPRTGALVIVVFLAGAGLLSAMVGNFGLRRGEPIVEWIFVMLALAAVLSLARAWCRLVSRLSGSEAASGETERAPFRGPVLLTHALCVFMLLAGVGLVVRGMTSEALNARPLRLDARTGEEALAATRAKFPAFADGPVDHFFTEVVALNDYRWEIPGGTDTGHWSRLFERRNQSRSTVYALEGARPYPGAGQLGAHFRGTLDRVERKRPYVLVGIRNVDPDPPMGHESLVIEGLALIPYEAETGRLDLAGAHYFPPTREAESLAGATPR